MTDSSDVLCKKNNKYFLNEVVIRAILVNKSRQNIREGEESQTVAHTLCWRGLFNNVSEQPDPK